MGRGGASTIPWSPRSSLSPDPPSPHLAPPPHQQELILCPANGCAYLRSNDSVCSKCQSPAADPRTGAKKKLRFWPVPDALQLKLMCPERMRLLDWHATRPTIEGKLCSVWGELGCCGPAVGRCCCLFRV